MVLSRWVSRINFPYLLTSYVIFRVSAFYGFLNICLDLNIQGETHDSIEDARTALQLYRKYLELSHNGGKEEFRKVLKALYEKGRKQDWKVPDIDSADGQGSPKSTNQWHGSDIISHNIYHCWCLYTMIFLEGDKLCTSKYFAMHSQLTSMGLSNANTDILWANLLIYCIDNTMKYISA